MPNQVSVNGKRIRTLRIALHMTQGQLSQYTGVDRGLISNIERGARNSVSLQTLNMLAAGLKVDPRELLATENEHNTRPAPKTDEEVINEYLEQYPHFRAGFAKLVGLRPEYVRRQLEAMIEALDAIESRTDHETEERPPRGHRNGIESNESVS